MISFRPVVSSLHTVSRPVPAKLRAPTTSSQDSSFCGSTTHLLTPRNAPLQRRARQTGCAVMAAQAASGKSTKSLVRKIVGALPIVLLISLALVPVTMTLASALKFGAASKTYQGVGNYYDAGIPIAVKAAAACLGAIFGFLHDVGAVAFSIVTSSWIFWPVAVIGLAAIMFRD